MLCSALTPARLCQLCTGFSEASLTSPAGLSRSHTVPAILAHLVLGRSKVRVQDLLWYRFPKGHRPVVYVRLFVAAGPTGLDWVVKLQSSRECQRQRFSGALTPCLVVRGCPSSVRESASVLVTQARVWALPEARPLLMLGLKPLDEVICVRRLDEICL